MKILVGGKRCIIESFKLDDNIFNIDDRAEMLYINIGVEFEQGVQYKDFKYFFETQEIKIKKAIDEDENIIDAFIKEHIVTIINRVLLWDSYDNIASELFLGDRVIVKESLTPAWVTGKFDKANPYYVLDNNMIVDYSIDELIKWGSVPKEESKNLNYKELKNFNLALDKVEFENKTDYDVIHEYHNGDERVKRFNVVEQGYEKAYNEALDYFQESIKEAED